MDDRRLCTVCKLHAEHTGRRLGADFEEHYKLVLNYPFEGSRLKQYFLHLGDPLRVRLVHAIVQGHGKLEGIYYAHSWIQFEDSQDRDWVFDNTDDKEALVPLATYNIIATPGIAPAPLRQKFQYQRRDLHNFKKQYESYGPWHLAPLPPTTIKANEAIWRKLHMFKGGS